MSMRTPLYDLHKEMGAVFGEYFGWELPERFSALEGEYLAVRQRIGIIDASYRASLQVTGRDRVRYLQSMLTNDVKSLSPGAGTHAALLNHRGHVLADMRVYALTDSFILDLDPHVKDKVIGSLTKYIVSDDVQIADVSSRWGIVSLQGPNAREMLNALLAEPLPELKEHQHVELKVGSLQVRIIKNPWVGEDGYSILVERERVPDIWQQFMVRGQDFGLKPVGMAALNTLRVEAGVPWYGYDIDESNLPQEANLEHAISFTKGCYIGQETVARLQFRGHLNKKLVGLKLGPGDLPQARDMVVKDEKEVGHVTSSVYSPAMRCPIALAYVRREFFEPGTKLDVRTSNGLIQAQVVPLPFYRRITVT